MKKRETSKILTDIKSLIMTKGYIYALCMIIYEDFHIILEELHEVDFRSRLNKNEVSLLLGFLIQNRIEFSTTDSPQNLIQLKGKTYELMEELHQSLMVPYYEKFQIILKKEHKIEDNRKDMQDFYSGENMFTEPIFYSGDGVYDFQYSDFLERKYKYDKEWLFEKRNFDIDKTKTILEQIKKILLKKSERVNFYSLKEKLPELLKKVKKDKANEDWEKYEKEVIPALEFHQYVNLFFDNEKNDTSFDVDNIRENGWNSFYWNLIDLFVIRKSDFDKNLDIDSFFSNFSIPFDSIGTNSQFKQIGDFNWFNAKPIIQLNDDRYFIPVTFSLYEASYESPFYWMWQDMSYKDKLSENRGRTGEEISYEFLSNVFGIGRTFRSVKIVTKKGCDDTDVDVLCILGSKALCIQVKSKKLTQLSRTGDDKQLQKDFKGAIQDAYEQGLVSRRKILEKKSKFYDAKGDLIKLSEGIDEVYIMGVTSENYPTLAHQSHTLLKKTDDEPYPIFLTVFDLELIAHYLNDPYDFLYYIRQRISLMDHFNAENEMIFLGYHLNQKLWKLPNCDYATLEPDFGGLIDRNYYPFRLGVDVSDRGDKIKNKWRNKEFEDLCNQLATFNQPKVTDVIFTLLDWNEDSRENLVKYINKTKEQTLKDGGFHNFSMVSGTDDTVTGVTYISLDADDFEELGERLLILCKGRKYKSKGDVWVGLGSLKSSSRKIDVVVFNNKKWEYNQELERVSKILFEGKNQGTKKMLGEKIDRNDKCPCGSGLKHKKCCG